MKKIFAVVAVIFLCSQASIAQSTYIVQFKDKGFNPYSLASPSAFLSQKAIERRVKYSIAIDSTDLPVTPRYVDSLRLAGNVTILNRSKWLNSVSIRTTDAAALTKINGFPFVKSVTAIAARLMNGRSSGKFPFETGTPASTKEQGITADYFDYGSSFAQVHIHNGEFLHNIGLRGQYMTIGMLDAGFNNYLNATAFDSARNNGQILGVYDFVAKDSSVNEDHPHGMECFSTMAANIPGQFVGTSPKASYYLFRTENSASEYPVEEHNWVCGAERVDSAGGDVISSSLGYNTFDAPMSSASHTYADMDGNTTMAAIGADLAAKKGLLVVIAAGNSGNDAWKYILTPADADSVLTVGAVSTSGVPAAFSSYGPSADGRVKPDVASVGQGTIIQFPNNNIGGGNGTSFACPNMAGLATCLWQGFPEFNNMKIIDALRQSGSQATAPDDRVGYGIPDVKKALVTLTKEFSSAQANIVNCTSTVEWTSKDVSGMQYEIERMTPGQNGFVKIGARAGSGNVFGTRAPYQFNDVLSGVAAGNISYRIRQVFDTSAAGFTAAYIDTVTIQLQSNCVDASLTDVTLLPNPAKDQFSIRVTTPAASSNIQIRICASNGQLVQQLKKTKPAGTVFFDGISLMRFATGKYYVSVYDNNKLVVTKELLKL